MLGLTSRLGAADLETAEIAYPRDFLRSSSETAVAGIAKAQGISQEDIMMRLRVLNQFAKLK